MPVLRCIHILRESLPTYNSNCISTLFWCDTHQSHFSCSKFQLSALPMVRPSPVPVLPPCRWCVRSWSWSPSFPLSWRVSLPSTVWSSLSLSPVLWMSHRNTRCTSKYISTYIPCSTFHPLHTKKGVCLLWAKIRQKMPRGSRNIIMLYRLALTFIKWTRKKIRNCQTFTP